MAKKKHADPKAETAARIQRTEAYAERVRLMFTATVNQILALNKTLPKLEPGVMFSFDGQSLKKQQEVERLLRQLHSVATMAIQQGITLEWGQANAAADTLLKSMFSKEVLSSPQFSAWTNRNSAAMNAFLSRSEKGLNLSQRVWKSVQQLRDEMEVAITVSIGEGESAQKMSQAVRKYLNDPDLMFRRFRYKAGEEPEYDADGNEIGKKIIWGKKWKKRIKKPDGTYGWIDYDRDSYKTGAGVYKSSVKNAMRVARTETNIAYRRADHERWQAMDFVLGQRVQLSRNHPERDICDKLAGDYPKDFIFDGWHPQCFCFVTPILVDESVMMEMNEAFFAGEDWEKILRDRCGKFQIKDYPDNFKQWVTDNAAHIQASRDRGTEPYFIRNNARVIDNIINPPKALTPLQIAEQRHAARTEEDKQKILNAWQERRERMEAEKDSKEIFIPAKTIDEAKDIATSLGIKQVNWGDATIDEINIALEVLHEASAQMDFELSNFILAKDLHKTPISQSTKPIGGFFNHDRNIMAIDLTTFRESQFKPVVSYKDKIGSLRNNIANLEKQIAQSEARLGRSKSMDRMMKADIKMFKSRIADIEIKINSFEKLIASGNDALPLTVAGSFEDIKKQVQAEIWHEIGHYVDYKTGRKKFKEGNFISEYCKDMRGEEFAEWFSYYKMNGEKGVPSDLLKIFKSVEPSKTETAAKAGKTASGGTSGTKTPLTDAQRKRRSTIREIARRQIVDKPITIPGLNKSATISGGKIKEWLNQPHSHIVEKNEALLQLPELLSTGKYIGYGVDEHDPTAIAHLVQVKICGEDSWVIIRELNDGTTRIHSISDNPTIVSNIKNKKP